MEPKNVGLKTVQWLVCLLCWITISPLFYLLARKWNLMKRAYRIVLLLVSPFFLICYLCLFLLGTSGLESYQRKYRFSDKEVIERITETKFPDFEVIDYHRGGISFHGDYNDKLIIEFDEIPSTFYLTLDSLINTGNTEWSKLGNTYSWSKIWGNGLPAPNGENDEEDMTLKISFEINEKQATINYGAW